MLVCNITYQINEIYTIIEEKNSLMLVCKLTSEIIDIENENF